MSEQLPDTNPKTLDTMAGTTDATVPEPAPKPPAAASIPPGPPTPPQPSPAAGPGPTPQYQVPGQNIGMLTGGAIGATNGGGGMVDGMVTGGVVGGIVGQRLAQAEKSAYWRGQAADYRASLAAGQPPLSEQANANGDEKAQGQKKPSWWSREAREQRKLRRWERRAERRDGTVLRDRE